MLYFRPIINTDGSWLNARFGTSVSFPILITLNILAILILLKYTDTIYIKEIKTFGQICALSL